MAERDLYIDRLRTITTAQVVVFHAAITYGSADRVVARLAHRNSCYRRSIWSWQVQVRWRLVVAFNPLRAMGTIRRLGPDRRMVTGFPFAHESTVGTLVLA
jgi:hypothetical protein